MSKLRQAKYQATYRKRSAYRAQADLLGWKRIDVLEAYVTTDDELVVIDREGGRYGTDADRLVAPVEAPDTLVSPADVPLTELGARFEASTEKFADYLAKLDLSTADRESVETNLTGIASGILRMIQALRENDGPDWRQAIGLKEKS